jgi:hypothetical protein
MKTKILKILLPLFIAIGMLLPAIAEDTDRTYTDPANVDADYAIQGEYSGTIDGKKIGVQVIALGDGNFDFVSYSGGLPGDGWDGKEKIVSSSITASEVAKISNHLSRIVRKSETLGMSPPPGAIILFDGSSTDAFTNAEMTEEKLLITGVTSKQVFGSHRIHLEFRTPYKPFARGQQRGNAGLYVQGRYETQILDSFGLAGEMDEAGGIYSIKAPDFNACFPPLSWQTYDIDFTAAEYKDGEKVRSARMTVRLNGFVIQDDIELPHATTASPLQEGPESGPVYLQDHSNPVVYRNIGLIET